MSADVSPNPDLRSDLEKAAIAAKGRFKDLLEKTANIRSNGRLVRGDVVPAILDASVGSLKRLFAEAYPAVAALAVLRGGDIKGVHALMNDCATVFIDYVMGLLTDHHEKMVVNEEQRSQIRRALEETHRALMLELPNAAGADQVIQPDLLDARPIFFEGAVVVTAPDDKAGGSAAARSVRITRTIRANQASIESLGKALVVALDERIAQLEGTLSNSGTEERDGLEKLRDLIAEFLQAIANKAAEEELAKAATTYTTRLKQFWAFLNDTTQPATTIMWFGVAAGMAHQAGTLPTLAAITLLGTKMANTLRAFGSDKAGDAIKGVGDGIKAGADVISKAIKK